jgi:hypothetical protein
MFTASCGRKVNDNKYYDLEMKEEPMCGIHVEFQTAAEADTFLGIAESFATNHGIAKSSLRAVRNNPSPHFKLGSIYQSDKVIISSFAVIAPEDLYGQSKMSVLRRDYPFSEFKALAESFGDSFRQNFTNRVRVTIDEGPK